MTVAGKKKSFDVELGDRQSGLFSKYWRVFKGLSKLPLDREVDVARKKGKRKEFSSQNTSKSIKRERGVQG